MTPQRENERQKEKHLDNMDMWLLTRVEIVKEVNRIRNYKV